MSVVTLLVDKSVSQSRQVIIDYWPINKMDGSYEPPGDVYRTI